MSGFPNEAGLPDELKTLETQLRQLTPAGSLDRDAVQYHAGYAAGRRSATPWMLTAIGTAVVSVSCCVALHQQPAPQTVEVRPAYVVVPTVIPSDTPDKPLPLREHFLRWGLEGQGTPPPELSTDLPPGTPLLTSLGALQP